jgi:hypothetical protein
MVKTIPLTPSVLAVATHKLKTIEERVTVQASNMRSQLKDTAPTLPEQIERTRTFIAQSHVGYELRQLSGSAEHVYLALIGFQDAMDEARRLRAEGQALLLAVKEQLAGLSPDDLVQLDHRGEMEKASGPLRYVVMNIGMLLDQATPLLPVARACVGRTIQAAAHVAREWMVKDVTTRIDRARVMLANAKVSNPECDRLDSLVVRAEKLLDVTLPVPALLWPDGDDPFAPPRLETS